VADDAALANLSPSTAKDDLVFGKAEDVLVPLSAEKFDGPVNVPVPVNANFWRVPTVANPVPACTIIKDSTFQVPASNGSIKVAELLRVVELSSPVSSAVNCADRHLPPKDSESARVIRLVASGVPLAFGAVGLVVLEKTCGPVWVSESTTASIPSLFGIVNVTSASSADGGLITPCLLPDGNTLINALRP
jgi:hypothetical protein